AASFPESSVSSVRLLTRSQAEGESLASGTKRNIRESSVPSTTFDWKRKTVTGGVGGRAIVPFRSSSPFIYLFNS
uniref:Uncharacterized protein n=1 Tax=Anopheles atroparvus TaxID=41427 RepID=A0AAG5CVQ5_ANOAO